MLDTSYLCQWECVVDRRSITRTLVVRSARLLFGEDASAHPCTVRDLTIRMGGIAIVLFGALASVKFFG